MTSLACKTGGPTNYVTRNDTYILDRILQRPDALPGINRMRGIQYHGPNSYLSNSCQMYMHIFYTKDHNLFTL